MTCLAAMAAALRAALLSSLLIGHARGNCRGIDRTALINLYEALDGASTRPALTRPRATPHPPSSAAQGPTGPTTRIGT